MSCNKSNHTTVDSYNYVMYRAEEAKILEEFARMTDVELGNWIMEQSKIKRSMENVVVYISANRLRVALSNFGEKKLANILYTSSMDILSEYGQDTEIDMPKSLGEVNKKDFSKEIRKWCSDFRCNEVAKALVVLYQGGILLDFLKEQLLTLDDVVYIVIKFYSDILDN